MKTKKIKNKKPEKRICGICRKLTHKESLTSAEFNKLKKCRCSEVRE